MAAELALVEKVVTGSSVSEERSHMFYFPESIVVYIFCTFLPESISLPNEMVVLTRANFVDIGLFGMCITQQSKCRFVIGVPFELF